jgi:hypothetical protein
MSTMHISKTYLCVMALAGAMVASSACEDEADKEDRVAARTGKLPGAKGKGVGASPSGAGGNVASGGNIASSASSPGPAANPNDAYLLMEGARYRKAIFRVSGGKVYPITMPSRCRYFSRLYAAPDGRVWVRCNSRLVARISGSKVEQLRGGRIDGVGRMAFSPKGDKAYYVSKKGVFTFKGGSWSQQDLPPEALESRGLTPHIVVDAKGQLWIALGSGVWTLSGKSFKRVELPAEKRPPYYRRIVATKNGAVWVEVKTRIGSRLLRVAGGEQKATKLRERYLILSGVHPTDDGGFFVRSSNDALWADAEGKRTRKVRLKKRFLGRPALGAEAVDGQGRLWLGTKYGLVIVNSAGAIQQWEPGRVAGLEQGGTMLYKVKDVVVCGKGPTLPKLGPKVRGTVKGRITAGAGVTVEMCPGAGVLKKFYGRTPCVYDSLRFTTVTDDQGNFTFENVPPYGMRLVTKRARGRWGLKRPSCCFGLLRKKTLDIGSFSK